MRSWPQPTSPLPAACRRLPRENSRSRRGHGEHKCCRASAGWSRRRRPPDTAHRAFAAAAAACRARYIPASRRAPDRPGAVHSGAWASLHRTSGKILVGLAVGLGSSSMVVNEVAPDIRDGIDAISLLLHPRESAVPSEPHQENPPSTRSSPLHRSVSRASCIDVPELMEFIDQHRRLVAVDRSLRSA